CFTLLTRFYKMDCLLLEFFGITWLVFCHDPLLQRVYQISLLQLYQTGGISKGQIYYTEQLGIDFVQEYFDIPQDEYSRTLNQAQTQELRVIRMVGDFQLHHAVLRRSLKHRKRLTDPYFIETSRQFAEDCVAARAYATSTVGHYTKQSDSFMDYLAARGMHDFSGISMETIHAYILTLSGFSYKTVEQNI